MNPPTIIVFDGGLQRYVVCAIRPTHENAKHPVYVMTKLTYEYEQDARRGADSFAPLEPKPA